MGQLPSAMSRCSSTRWTSSKLKHVRGRGLYRLRVGTYRVIYLGGRHARSSCSRSTGATTRPMSTWTGSSCTGAARGSRSPRSPRRRRRLPGRSPGAPPTVAPSSRSCENPLTVFGTPELESVGLDGRAHRPTAHVLRHGRDRRGAGRAGRRAGARSSWSRTCGTTASATWRSSPPAARRRRTTPASTTPSWPSACARRSRPTPSPRSTRATSSSCCVARSRNGCSTCTRRRRGSCSHVANGPSRVRGGPGTGKTVAALHRARHLVRAGLADTVLLTTFVNVLPSVWITLLGRFAPEEANAHLRPHRRPPRDGDHGGRGRCADVHRGRGAAQPDGEALPAVFPVWPRRSAAPPSWGPSSRP